MQQQTEVKRIIKVETLGSAFMLSMAVLALVLDNSPWASYYEYILSLDLTFTLNGYGLSKDLLHWVNDGLMTIFFLNVGLEIKREMEEGELDTLEKRTLPGIAALGGILIPAVIFIALNFHDPIALRGWAIPTATDIAFSLGTLALLGTRIPPALKIFLLAIAVFDDIAAILIIAVFYTAKISFLALTLSFVTIFIMFLLNALRVKQLGPYFILGIILWFLVLRSGVHATLSGVALAFAIPLKDPDNPEASLTWSVEKALQPWVMFVVLPIFAFANAGVSLIGIHFSYFLNTLPLGIILGLFLGKLSGITSFTWLAVKTRIAQLPENVNWTGVFGVSMLCGIGFTMSLFIGTLAFREAESVYAALVRVGVLTGSILSGIIGYLFLRFTLSERAHTVQQTTR